MSITPPAETPWLKKCKQFADNVISPSLLKYDKENRFPNEVHREARRWEMLDQDFPQVLGGAGLSGVQAVVGAEILSAACAPIAFTMGFNRGALHPILIAGTEKQKREFIGKTILNGDYASLCLTESNTSGSNLMGLETTAHRKGAGWHIRGHKCMVGNGGVSTLFVTLAKTFENGQQTGISFFAIPKHKGVEVSENTDKLGFRAVETNSITIDADVSDFHRIGEIGSGPQLLLETLANIRVGGSAVILGIVCGAINDAMPWIESREVYGGLLGRKSHVQLMLGDLYGRLISVRQTIMHAAVQRESNTDYRQSAAIAKLHASKLALDATSQITQLFGWRGIDNDYPIQKRYRDAKQTSIFEGSAEIQQLSLFHALSNTWKAAGDR